MKNNNIITFSSTLKIPKQCFNILGLSLVNEEKNTKFLRYFKTSYFWIQYLSLIICILSQTTQLIVTLNHSNDFLKAIENLTYIGFPVITQSKLLLIYMERKKFNFIIEELRDFFPKTCIEQYKDKIVLYMKRTNNLLKLFIIINVLLIWAFNLLPLGDTILTYIQTKKWTPQLPFHFWYPYDEYQNGLYEFSYIFQIWNSSNASSASIAVNVLFCTLGAHIYFHFKKIQNLIICMKIERGKYEDFISIHEIIEKHQRLIQMSFQFNSIYSLPLFFNFLSSSVIICLSGFMVLVSCMIKENSFF